MITKNLLKSGTILFIAAAIITACTGKSETVSLSKMRKLAQNHSLVIAYHDGRVKTYDDNGIKPLFLHLKAAGDFKDAYVFDKVTGKASALILAYGKASTLYTNILSKEAIPVLEKYNISYSADKIVNYIYNATEDGMCPMEQTVLKTEDPQEAYTQLREAITKLN